MSADREIDWLVAGAGAGGMTGAVVAHQLGGTALVVEKEPVYGGTTAKSGGVAWIPGNHRLPELGIDDSPEEGYRYLKGLIGDSVPDARLRAYAEGAPSMLRFMMAHSHVHYTPLPAYMDYYEEVPGYKSGGRSMDPAPLHIRHLGRAAASMSRDHYTGLLLPFNVSVVEGRRLQEMDLGAYLLGAKLAARYYADLPARLARRGDDRLTLGPALVARLRRSLLDRDIPLWLDAPVTELLTEGGRVCGARVTHKGESVTVTARRGVLLCTGGFARNAALRQRYQPQPSSDRWTAAAPGSTGDGIRLGEQVNASLGFMGSAWWSPTYILPDGRSLALISGKSNPGSIMVNRQGRRFANEAQPYEDLVKAQYASEARGEGAIPCYLVFDSLFRQRYTAGHIKPAKITPDDKLPADYFTSGLLARADTLGQLADKLGIDAATLERTVQRFNEHARLGEDPDFGRGRSLHDRYYADPRVEPNPSLAPLDRGPFYALRCEPGDLDTKGGLLCDEHARVLDGDRRPIAGLYAAGNASAAVMGDTYPGAGSTIGSAMTFAYIAARHAFKETGQGGTP
ncbi:FAD-binding protein [Parahaliea mediterranea]|uniref:FAD-binding protein n=1 Tax=Parahaliea mediterranea TaxID=651086 RepID=A0A939DEC4_9GAMM|nr:FAD-binding protein [Parahaliea mediterranea]MBN7796715.1 FAD-binding protein [Parahaliea mediterranea]